MVSLFRISKYYRAAHLFTMSQRKRPLQHTCGTAAAIQGSCRVCNASFTQVLPFHDTLRKAWEKYQSVPDALNTFTEVGLWFLWNISHVGKHI